MSLMMGGSIRGYFLEELRGLREDADHFARDYPAVARELGISRGRSKDPQVELLMQSFAYLTGRLQYRLDEERANLPNMLLGQLYPHLQSPLPSMTVAHIDVQADGANFSGGWLLSRGRQLRARASNGKGRTVDCRFSTCYDTPLWPLTIRELGLTPTNHYDFLSQDSVVQSVLRIQLGVLGHDPIKGLGIDSLRFHIQGDGLTACALYDLLATHCVGLAVRSSRDGSVHRLGCDALQWLGFAEEEAVLPTSPLTHSGYRLLQEYFAFREKFLFFELRGLDCSESIDQLELLLLMDSVPPKGLQLKPDTLALNCVPIVNLFSKSLEPLRLDQRNYEYRLIGDAASHDYCEIHSLQELVAIRPDAEPRPVAPYFSVEQQEQLQAQDYFYVTRRAESQFKSIPGTELFVSFLDTQLDLSHPPADIISGKALCTNRRLPEQLSAGDRLQLEGAGPVSAIRLVVKPTTHKTPDLLGAEPWALLSQLSLNHLSLDGDPRALEAFKRILALNADPGTPANLREIEAIRRLESRPIVQHLGKDFWRGLSRGERIRLEVDEEAFYGGTAVLFAEVLQHFFSLFANVNTFTQLALESKQRKETWKLWPPMVGARPVL